MATKTSKKRVVKNSKKSNADHKKGVWPGIKRDFSKLNQQRRNFLQRRPHRSFRLTKRRDYRRDLKIPGYWSLTSEACRLVWRNKKTFFGVNRRYVNIDVCFSQRHVARYVPTT